MKQEIFNLIDDVIRSAKNVGYCTDYEGEVEEEESNLSGYERELRKKIEDIEEENASLTVELETVKRERKELRFELSEKSRFVWWVWNVYAKNVSDLLVELECSSSPFTLINMSSSIKYLKEYTDNIYNGTYLRSDISVDVKRELTDIEIEQLGAAEAEIKGE
jgi:hypothetical protein